MNRPLVSFCVPTYNRSRYLESLLDMLVTQLAEFPYSYEVFVSDNASTDTTPEVVESFRERLPIRYTRHDENRGGPANWQHVMSQARGTYLIYLADDDALLGDRVADVIARLEQNPDVGIAYAPWMLYDLVAGEPKGQFYRQDRDLRIERGDQRALLDALLRHAVFPEIYVCRRELLAQVKPRIHEQAFYAFVHASEFLERAGVLLLKDPFYVSITRYFADTPQRTQAGGEEAEYAWDRYRGGLEYILSRACATTTAMGDAERIGFSLRIQDLIAQRISVAVRLRHRGGRNAVETYYLASRLRALGAQKLLPVPMETLRARAAMDFLLHDPELNRGVGALAFAGEVEPALREYVEAHATRPLHFLGRGAPLGELRDTLVLARGSYTPDLSADALQAANVRVVAEAELMQKFPG
ncbi:glycosyltransferase family 2 protein [Aquabacterium sp. A7-Y]|uniref:glycosyltransferase family 2 protein n=1 Tax=Aquabacterium sp. A7-Y TaxID=1349605 RepID=UPI00223E024E|nr:glycosyltransferase family A protein [Aquabacterium sp. A7-Y]MCW7540528.1 glycosyltransferase family 2 protein [Aquabacterium sp. A7-Y]